MRSLSLLAGCAAALLSFAQAEANLSNPDVSKQMLSGTFEPPQVFQHTNLVRTVNLEKEYPRETINVVVENIDSKAQQEYYLPFPQDLIARVGGLDVKDKNKPDAIFPSPEIVGIDTYRRSPIEYYRVTFPTPLAPKEKLTLSITYSILSALSPLPASIAQADKQYVQITLNAYTNSAYKTLKQKTKLKMPTNDVPEYTVVGTNAEGQQDPVKQGVSFTYGPYGEVPAGANQPVSLRYEFTKPLLHASLVERDIEVSHWGGNIATEERYWLENRGATLKNQFSRVQWQQTQYFNPPSSALKELEYPLIIGSANPYFIDDIGNVSTSRFRPRNTPKEALLQLKPRYPVFGGWKYSFKVGWDNDLKNFLRKLKTGDGYVLKVPFLEGPKQPEGLEIEKLILRVVLPEGATNIKFETKVPIISSEVSTHRTFMDTIGRSTLQLTALNVVDDFRGKDLVVTYDYPVLAGFRKPIVIFASLMGTFGVAYLISRLDVSIGKKA
ncbi:oligosaccharyltransferase alpha subunit [Aureobasidium subglaciale]|nr:oligosaccharyltransferase alpha subunit [Aureobasidium subglaciale]